MNRRRWMAGATVALGTAGAVAIACGPGDLRGLTHNLDASASAIDTCAHAGPPAPPANADDTGSKGDLTFAVSALRIDASSSTSAAGLAPPAGIDLDNACTCPGSSTCTPILGGQTSCDDDAGRDDATGKLLGNIIDVLGALEPDTLTQRIHDGKYTLLIDVVGWNGNADDPHVVVSVRTSTGIDDGSGVAPKLDGTDAWLVDPASITDGNALSVASAQCTSTTCIPYAIDNNGYVAGNTVVAHFDKVNLTFAAADTGLVSVPMVGATLVATLATSSKGTALQGELDGRWPADSLLAAAGTFVPQDSDAGKDAVCGAGYAQFKTAVCQAADLAATPSQDNTGAPCAALSEALRFSAIPAQAGHVRASSSTATSCRGPQTAADTCEGSH